MDASDLLTGICRTLGPQWRCAADARFLWATPYPQDEHARLAAHAHHALDRLGQLGLDPGRELIPAVLLPDQATQLAYHGVFDRVEEGGPEATIVDGGVWRTWPVGHLAIPVSRWDALDAAFAHELTHAVLCGEGVPIWLQEGIACEVETWMGNRPDPFADEIAFAATLAWGRTADPQSLWDGAAFRDPASSEHAYRLAQVLALRWTRHHGLADLRAADWRDEDLALLRLAGCSRSELLAATLDPPPPRGLLHRLFAAMFTGGR